MAAKPNIFLFVPNLIGFARVVLLVVSLFYLVSAVVCLSPLRAMCAARSRCFSASMTWKYGGI